MVPLSIRYVWSVDFHGAPIACNLPLLVEQGAAIHAEVDFDNCVYYGVCKRRLAVLGFDDWRGFSLDSPTPHELTARFVAHYASDAEFARVDGVICSHPAANCELFVPLNKSLVVYLTTRLEVTGSRWRAPHQDSLLHNSE